MEMGICTLEDVFTKRKLKKNFWSENEILKISYGLISALNAAKNFGISHRDLSLNNIILSLKMDEYKLIDFGESQHFVEDIENLPVVGKFSFMAPELFQIIKDIQKGKIKEISQYDAEKSDVFSLGIILLDLCLLEKINVLNYENILSSLRKIEKNYPKVKTLIEKMVNYMPIKRKSFSSLFYLISNYEKLIDNTIFSEIDFLDQ